MGNEVKIMSHKESYTPEEIARLLKVSKLTVYDLIKKGQLSAFRVGRQMRVDAIELENYKLRGKEVKTDDGSSKQPTPDTSPSSSVVICGQDNSLDILAGELEKQINEMPLRSYTGSLDSLIGLYKGKANIVSTHLFDGDTGTYNIPYVRKLLVSKSFIVIGFIKRIAGFYVAKGNPKSITSWPDLMKKGITIVNREPGAGARILLDEQFRLHDINKLQVAGYEQEMKSHLDIASAIASGKADVGVGIEQVSKLAPVDFIPLIEESYDLVLLKNEENMQLISAVRKILKSKDFQEKLRSLGYNMDNIGEIRWEQ